MDPMEAERLLRKLDRRLEQVEQILPTLPSRAEMQAAIAEAVAPLVTNEHLDAVIGAAIAPLATKAGLVTAIAPLSTKAELAAAIAPLATKTELAAAIAPLATKAELAAAIAPLATKAELAAAIAPLATKTELAAAIAPLATRDEVREEGVQTRQHFDVVAESLRDDIRLVAEHQVAFQAEVKRGFKDVGGRLNNHEKRITRLEARERKRPRR